MTTRLFSIISLIIISNWGYSELMAQTGFSLSFPDSTDCTITGLTEDNGTYYLTTYQAPLQSESYTKIRKVSNTGEVFIHQDILMYNKFTNLIPVINTDTGSLYIGNLTNSDFYSLSDIIILNFDSEFNLNWHVRYINEHVRPLSFSALKKENYFLYITDAFDIINLNRDIHLYKCNYNGELLKKNIIGSTAYQERLCASTFKFDTDTLVVLSTGFASLTYPMKAVEVDTNLEMVEIKEIHTGSFIYNNITPFNNENYLFTGKYHYTNSSPRDDDLAVMYMNNDYAILKEKHFGASDTVDFPAYTKTISFIDPTRIFCGYNKNQDPLNLFSTNLTWFSLVLLNDSLEVQWERFYGGDANYGLWHILATSDGGCLLAGTRYDWTTQYNERDAILIKVDENGLITSTGPGPSIQARDAIVYPNPGRERLTIERGPQIAGAKFVLNDMAGKTLIEKTLNHTTETLPTAHLPAGLYLWNITHKGKAVENGKWVKE